MKRLIILAALVLQGGGQPINIPVKNQSFVLGYGATFSEDLGVSPLQIEALPDGGYGEGVYTLTLSVQNFHISYPGQFTVQLNFGTQKLCDASRWADKAVTQVTFDCPMPGYLLVDHSLSTTSDVVGPPQGSNNLVLVVSGWEYWQVDVAAVSLTFTPTQ